MAYERVGNAEKSCMSMSDTKLTIDVDVPSKEDKQFEDVSGLSITNPILCR